MKKTFFTTLLLIVLTTVASAQIKLNYSLDTNTSYSSNVMIEQTISQTVMGQTQDIQSDQGYGVTITVNEVNSDTYLLNMFYNSVMINSPMMGLTYDSDNSANEPTGPAKAIASVVGTDFNFELTNNGTVNNISGIEAMLDTMAASMDFDSEEQATVFKSQMAAQYNVETLKSQMKRTMIIFPDKKLNKGDSWSADESVNTPFPMNIQTMYELADYDSETATINVSSDIFSELQQLNMNGATMTPDLTGEQFGTIVIDRSTGLVLSIELEQLISGVMSMTSPQKMEIPIEITGATNITGKVD